MSKYTKLQYPMKNNLNFYTYICKKLMKREVININAIINTTLIGIFFGTFGTTIGGLIGIFSPYTSKKFLSMLLSFSAGLMLAIVCFDLLPEAMQLSNIGSVILGIIIGITVMLFCEAYIKRNKKVEKQNTKQNLLTTGMIISIGLALHNFPEGLAIGSGFEASIVLGYSLAIAICFHDIPEGISMAVPMKAGGMKPFKVIYYVILSGLTTGLGACIGACIGGISTQVISFCLSFAAGAMLYIVSGELIPESNKLYQGKISILGNILGFLLGFLAMNIV